MLPDAAIQSDAAEPYGTVRPNVNALITQLTIPEDRVTLITPRTLAYVERYRGFAKKTAECVVELAKTLIEAEQTLDASEQREFFRHVSIVKGSSVYKKLHVIGDRHSRFLPYMHKLPGTWTTLYLLARMPHDEFDRLARSHILSPTTTARAITDATPKKKKTPACAVILQLAETSDATTACLDQKLTAFFSSIGVSARMNEALSNVVHAARERLRERSATTKRKTA